MSDISEMVKASGPLLETAVQPFGDNLEEKIGAVQFLESIKISSHAEAAVISRWRQVDGQKHPRMRKWAPWVVLALVAAVVGLRDFEELYRYLLVADNGRTPFGEFWRSDGSISEIRKRMGSNLTEEEKLLLFGDENKMFDGYQKEAPWRAEPTNAAFFSEYAAECAASFRNQLPQDFSATVNRIDPDNAWFTLLAAGAEAFKCVRRDNRVGKGNVINILDQAGLERCLALLNEASLQPKCESYHAALMQRRIPLIRQRTILESLEGDTVLEYADGLSYSQERILQSLFEAILAAAQVCEDSRNVTGFQQLTADSREFLRKLHGMEGRFYDVERKYWSMAFSIGRKFASAAEKLGLSEEARQWGAVYEKLTRRLEQIKSQDRSAPLLPNGEPVGWDNAFGLLGRGLSVHSRSVVTFPALTSEDTKPGRLADMEIFSWILSLSAVIPLGVLAGAASLNRFRVTKISRTLAGRMADLLRTSDWLWVFGFGVIAPFASLMAFLRIRYHSLHEIWLVPGPILPILYFILLLSLWLIALAVTIRWRLAKRAGIFGFSKWSWWTGIALVCCGALVPVIAQVYVSRHAPSIESNLVKVMYGLGAVPIAWVVLNSFLALFGRTIGQFRRVAISILLVKALGMAMLVAILSSVPFKAASQYWCERDVLMKADASVPCVHRYEHKVVVQLRKEIDEVLEGTLLDL